MMPDTRARGQGPSLSCPNRRIALILATRAPRARRNL